MRGTAEADMIFTICSWQSSIPGMRRHDCMIPVSKARSSGELSSGASWMVEAKSRTPSATTCRRISRIIGMMVVDCLARNDTRRSSSPGILVSVWMRRERKSSFRRER
jgi:hypothetical protein